MPISPCTRPRTPDAIRLRFFDPAMQTALDERSALETDLRQALEQHQLRLYYQPQIDSSARPRRRRGVAALAASGARAGRAGRVHPAGRGNRADPAHRPMGAGNRLRPDQGLGEQSAHPRTAACRQCQRTPVPPTGFRRAGPAGAFGLSGANPTRLKIELTESLLIDNVS